MTTDGDDIDPEALARVAATLFAAGARGDDLEPVIAAVAGIAASPAASAHAGEVRRGVHAALGESEADQLGAGSAPLATLAARLRRVQAQLVHRALGDRPRTTHPGPPAPDPGPSR